MNAPRQLAPFACIFLLFANLNCTTPPDLPPPNILWITAEDMSPVLGYLGDTYAVTPNLDELAGESIIYSHAFATAPVCSPSRAALINGMMASVQGAHQMRSDYPLPEGWDGFPALLRDAGYYTTNNVKTDYNSGRADTIIAASWNENSATADWRGRAEEQPFFAVFNHMVSHQSRSMVWPYETFQAEVQSALTPEQIHDPAAAPVPPYYPDTPLVRQTIARFYDCVTVMDKQVGEVLARLEADGLMDDTIIFFYSDHGSGLPRHKRALLDSGMHVPLLVRFPEKYQHLAPLDAGATTDRLVNFADFGPTVLSLTGVAVPPYMQGVPFLGPAAGPLHRYVFGHRDRIDEAIDMSRSVRDQRYHYVRHYMPHLSYNQQTAWPDQGAIRHVFYAEAAKGAMTPAQTHFAGPTKPIEELYDSFEDPQHLNNLAADPAFAEIKTRLQEALNEHLVDNYDLGFIPEIEMALQAGGSAPYDWARSGAYDVEVHMNAAAHVGTDNFTAFDQALNSTLPGVRYWGAVGYTAASSLSRDAVGTLRKALSDTSPIVRIEAATALLKHRQPAGALETLTNLLMDDNEMVILYAARAIEIAGENARAAIDDMQVLNDKYEGITTDPGLFIGFATSGFLSRVKG
ncbi:MAG: sulfatase-like hydrolase/transferase [Bacteroidota bacterium]